MRNSKFNMKIALGLLFILFLCYLGLQNRYKNQTKEIFAKASYSIAEVTMYYGEKPAILTPGSGINQPARSKSVFYKFSHNGSFYDSSMDAIQGYFPEIEIKIGDRFMVVYNKEDPLMNRILLQYPILDSSDFGKYIKEFEIQKPNFR